MFHQFAEPIAQFADNSLGFLMLFFPLFSIFFHLPSGFFLLFGDFLKHCPHFFKSQSLAGGGQSVECCRFHNILLALI